MKRKNYGGSDLGQGFKDFFNREKNRISRILWERGCKKVQMNYGFNYFSGFFTAPSGQIYYFSCSDVRHWGYDQLLIRTATSYKDFTGGSNQYVGVKKADLMKFRLQ